MTFQIKDSISHINTPKNEILGYKSKKKIRRIYLGKVTKLWKTIKLYSSSSVLSTVPTSLSLFLILFHLHSPRHPVSSGHMQPIPGPQTSGGDPHQLPPRTGAAAMQPPEHQKNHASEVQPDDLRCSLSKGDHLEPKTSLVQVGHRRPRAPFLRPICCTCWPRCPLRASQLLPGPLLPSYPGPRGPPALPCRASHPGPGPTGICPTGHLAHPHGDPNGTPKLTGAGRPYSPPPQSPTSSHVLSISLKGLRSDSSPEPASHP